MTLLDLMRNLNTEQLLALHDTLLEAALANDLSGDYKTLFKRARESSKGNLKKLYSRLAKATSHEITDMADALIGFLPHGIKGIKRHA